VDLGSGTLQIDAMAGNCTFQGKQIDRLRIAEEIRTWIRDDLTANNIPADALTNARLSVKLSFSVVPRSVPKEQIFYSAGRAVRTEQMNRCLMECDSHVATNEAVYRSHRTEVQEWPIGWPANDVDLRTST